ncbi:MAG TPA: hypothetical protein VF498_18120 [Anaerolineales bacterium]
MHPRKLFSFLVLLSMLTIPFASVAPARAADSVALVDQSNYFQYGAVSIWFAGTLFGQSFTPTLPVLDVVELLTEDFNWGNGYGIELFVNIRKTTIDGPILGTSNIVQLPDKFSGNTRFTFPAVVSLTPGELYVIEVVPASGQDVYKTNWGIRYGGNWMGSPYPGGSAIFKGIESPIIDLWFWEGLASKSPQTSASCKKGLWAYLSRADGSSFVNQGDCIQYVNKGE